MNQLGDLLFSLPVLKTAGEEIGAKICSVVNPALAPILVSSKLIECAYDKKMPFLNLVRKIKKEEFSKAVLFSESPSSLLAAFLAGIGARYGFGTASMKFLLTNKVDRKGVPSLLNNHILGHSLGLKNIQPDYTGIIKIPETNIQNVKKWFKDNGVNPKKVIAVSTGSSKKRQNKRLADSKWVEVIDSLSQKGFECVLSGAKFEENDMSSLSSICKSRPKIFAAESILDSAAFLKEASLFTGIDSGAMHLAAAVGTKCVGVFGNTDPMQVGPMPLHKHIIVKKENISDVEASDIVGKVLEAAGQI